MKYYLKLKTGFKENEFVTIPMQEAHKAYYLFKNPETRGVFDNGVAILGKNIMQILPDWNATLGYNPDYKLIDEDYNEIRGKGYEQKMRNLIELSKQAGDIAVSIADKEAQKLFLQTELKEIIPSLPETSLTKLLK